MAISAFKFLSFRSAVVAKIIAIQLPFQWIHIDFHLLELNSRDEICRGFIERVPHYETERFVRS